MGIYTEAVQKLYVAYFSRPADPAGLAYWEGVVAASPTHSTAAVSAAFAASAEYKAAYAGLTETQVVNTIYNNLFGRNAEPAGLLYWAAALQAKTITVDNMVATIANAAQGTDATAYANKVAAATAFTLALDTTAEILGYNGTAANAAAKLFLAGITTTATLDAALVPAALDAAVIKVTTPVPVDVNVALTTGVDKIIGTANNETISGSATTYTGLDTIDGGQGNDTLVLSDVAGGTINVALATVTGVENLQYTSTGGIGAVGVANISGWTGLTSATFALQGANNATITAAGTTDVVVSNSGDAAVTVNGGEDVTVTTGNAAVSITGANLHTATVTGGATVVVGDLTKKTLTAVKLDGNVGNATITGDMVDTVSVANTAAATTVIAAAATRTLNLALNKVTAGADITDATATAVAITTSGTASDIDLSVAAAKTLTIAGDKGLTLSSLTAAALTSITSTSTGAVTITPALATGITYTGFSGADTIEVGATTKAITTGAGDDVVTVSVSALGTGGSIAAGDGTGDVLSMTSSNAATASASTTFAGTISGFEKLKLAAVAASTTDTIDLANLDNINYVQSAGTTAGTPSTPAGKEVTTVTVSGVASHADTVTFDGKIVQLANGDTATQAAAKIAATSFTNYTVTASGAVLTVTNKVGGLATDLAAGDFVFTDALSTGKPTVAVATTVQGVTAVAPVVDTSEVQNMLVAGTSTGPVTFLGAAVAGTVGGQAAAAVIGAILSDSANVIATWNAANPSRELLSIAAGAGVDDLDLTFKITEGNVAPMAGAVSNGISFGNATTTTEGSLAAPAVVAVAEQFTASFAGVATGADEIVFDGVTITLADNDTSAQIAAKVALGAFPNWNATVSGSVVTFTSDPAEARTDVTATNFTINDIAAAAGTQSVVVAVATQGTAAVTGTAGVLELTNMASGGTLEINAAGGYGVAVKDASSGTADVLNLKLSSDGVLAAGTVTVANVETVNINGIDSDSTAHVDSLTLVATSAKTITVTGNAGLTLTNTGNTKVTSFDASSVTAGAVTFTSANTTATDSVSIKGGAGADVLVGNAGSDTIIGGAGADSLNGAGGVNTLTGGDGKDTFIFTTVAESAVKASTVTDLKAGDMIALNIGTALVDADLKLGAAVTGLDVTTAVFQDWVDASVSTVVAGGISWFQYLGNTYIVQDLGGNSSTFTNGEDNIIKITGNVDLTASTVVLGTGIVTIV